MALVARIRLQDSVDFAAVVDRRLADGGGLPNDEWLLRFHARVAKLN